MEEVRRKKGRGENVEVRKWMYIDIRRRRSIKKGMKSGKSRKKNL